MTRRSLTDSQGQLVCTSALRIQVCVMGTKLERFSCWEALLVSQNSSDHIRDPPMRVIFPQFSLVRRSSRGVPAEGIEPTRSCDHWILSLLRNDNVYERISRILLT
jgi:hypothetical protein